MNIFVTLFNYLWKNEYGTNMVAGKAADYIPWLGELQHPQKIAVLQVSDKEWNQWQPPGKKTIMIYEKLIKSNHVTFNAAY